MYCSHNKIFMLAELMVHLKYDDINAFLENASTYLKTDIIPFSTSCFGFCLQQDTAKNLNIGRPKIITTILS